MLPALFSEALDDLGSVAAEQVARRMLDVMRQTTEAEASKPEFRKELAVKLKDIMNTLLEEYEDFGGVEEVMFTSFVMQ